jgi:Papain-like cysteine protease AvrRpt2
MPQTVRQYWSNLRGRSQLNFNWGAINQDSVVTITASEYTPDGNDPKHSPRFVGAATITVENISPHGPPNDPNHGVTFVVNVDWGAPLHVVTDITVMDAPPVDIEYQKSILRFVMPKQQQSNWCWAATSTGVATYYNAASTWTQCLVANSQTGRTDCCGVGASTSCNITEPLDNPLSIVGHLDHMVIAVEPFATVAGEVDAGRPLCIRIAWSGGGAHFIAAIGYIGSNPATGEFVSVDDPIYGPSDVSYTALQSSYQSTGSWTRSYFTKA